MPSKKKYLGVIALCWIFGAIVSSVVSVGTNYAVDLNLFIIAVPIFLVYYIKKNMERVKQMDIKAMVVVAVLLVFTFLGAFTSIYQTFFMAP